MMLAESKSRVGLFRGKQVPVLVGGVLYSVSRCSWGFGEREIVDGINGVRNFGESKSMCVMLFGFALLWPPSQAKANNILLYGTKVQGNAST